jgi:hypothetical protein
MEYAYYFVDGTWNMPTTLTFVGCVLQGLSSIGERLLTKQLALFRRKVDRLLHKKLDGNLRRYLGLVVLVCLIDNFGFEGARQAIAR